MPPNNVQLTVDNETGIVTQQQTFTVPIQQLIQRYNETIVILQQLSTIIAQVQSAPSVDPVTVDIINAVPAVDVTALQISTAVTTLQNKIATPAQKI